jgi:sulfofructose kinase
MTVRSDPSSPPSDGAASSPRVVCIGSAALDVLMEIDEMPPEDGRIAALDGTLAGGGPAATAAVALARLGVPTELIAVVGDDIAGDLIVAGLTRAGVGTRFVDRGPAARSALSVGLIRPRPADTRSLVALSAVGARIGVTDDALEACQAAAWIHVDHAGWPLVAWLRRRGVRTPVAVDGGNPLAPADLSDADLYVPGMTELLRSTGCTTVPAALQTASDRGARATIVTQGADGSTYLGPFDADAPDADSRFQERGDDPGTATGSAAATHGAHVPSPRVAVRSTLGAGDVYHGALLAGLLDGRSIRGAMAYASTAAALACRALDGRSAIPTHAEVLDHLASNEPPRR